MSDWAALTVKKFEMLIGPLRERARELGYAIGVHGSLARDIDLIAVPWTSEAVAPIELAEALRQRAAELNNDVAFCVDRIGASNPAHFITGRPGAKPHGRLTWSFHLGGGPYLDLSVMPLWPDAPDYMLVDTSEGKKAQLSGEAGKR